jgi:hypothetical protein
MADALVVHCHPLEETRAPNSSCQWLAEWEADGRRFAARSRQGAVYEMARMLVAAGIEDRPLRVTFAGVAGHMTWGSFAAAARWTLTEGVANTAAQKAMEKFRRKAVTYLTKQGRLSFPPLLPLSGKYLHRAGRRYTLGVIYEKAVQSVASSGTKLGT